MSRDIFLKVNYENTRMASVNGATNYIRNKIILQQFPADMQLTEIQMAEECGASRGSIRTAFQELEREGLIHALPNGRKQVAPFTLKSVADLYEVRRMLETCALKSILSDRSGSRKSEPELLYTAMISSSALQEGEALSPAKRVRMDADFHRTLIKAAGNQALLQCWSTIEPVIWAMLTINATISDQEQHFKQFDFHNELVRHLMLADPHVIEEFEEHISVSHSMVVEVLKRFNCQ